MSELIQGSEAWKQIRLGKVTASRIADVIAKTRTGWGASRANYQAQLIAERLTGEPQDTYQNAAMLHGIETEPEARAAYSFRTDADVTEVGFVPHPIIDDSGCSPDGLVAPNGMLEIKCPSTAVHIETLLGQSIADKYIVQMLWQMRCCNRVWCDFVSFDPRMPENMRLLIKRIHRDDARIAELEKLVSEFLAETDRKVEQLNALYAQKEAA